MSLSLWLHLCNTELCLRKHLMHSIGLPTLGSRSNHMFLMVCRMNFLLNSFFKFHVPAIIAFKTAIIFCISLVIRASVPKLELDSVFEQKNDIAKAVEEELEKVFILFYSLCFLFFFSWYKIFFSRSLTVVTCIHSY